jgi:hypothetical protein
MSFKFTDSLSFEKSHHCDVWERLERVHTRQVPKGFVFLPADTWLRSKGQTIPD